MLAYTKVVIYHLSFAIFVLLLITSFFMYMAVEVKQKKIKIILHKANKFGSKKSCKLSQNPEYYPCELAKYHNGYINTTRMNKNRASNILNQ